MDLRIGISQHHMKQSLRSQLALVCVLLLVPLTAAAQELELIVEDVAVLPMPGHVAVPSHELVDGKLWYFGGRLAQDPVQSFEEIWTYDPRLDLWDLQSVPLPYEGSNSNHTSAVFLQGRFYLAQLLATGDRGGFGSHNRPVIVDLYTQSSFEGPAFPFHRIWGSEPAVTADQIFYFGGWTGSPQAGIWELDPTSLTLTQVASMSQPSNDVMPTLGSDGWIYYWGRLLPNIERFHPLTHQVEVLHSSTGFPGPDHNAYVRWHLPEESKIYFTKAANGAAPSSMIFAFDYASDQVIATGLEAPGDIVNQQAIRDPEDASVIYAMRVLTDFASPMKVTRLTLAPRCTFGPESPFIFARSPGKPQWEDHVWESCGGHGVMAVATDHISSAWVYLNGDLVLGGSDFQKQSQILEQDVTLLSGENVIIVKVAGKPGSTLRISFEAGMSSPP